jgi:hypothetical protein
VVRGVGVLVLRRGAFLGAEVPVVGREETVASETMLGCCGCPAGRRLVLEFTYDAFEFSHATSQTGDLVCALVVAALVFYFVDAVAGEAKLGASTAWTLAVALALVLMAGEAGLGCAIAALLAVVDVF